jgi:hypothetical protein
LLLPRIARRTQHVSKPHLFDNVSCMRSLAYCLLPAPPLHPSADMLVLARMLLACVRLLLGVRVRELSRNDDVICGRRHGFPESAHPER